MRNGWELVLAYMNRIHVETGPRWSRKRTQARRPGKQGAELALAYAWRIHIEIGPRRVAEAIAGTAQIRCG